MRKGLVLSALYPDSRKSLSYLLDLIRQIHDDGKFDAVEFYYEGNMSDYKIIGDTLMANEMDSIFLAGFEMKRDSIDLGSNSFLLRQLAVNRCKTLIDCAYSLNSKKMLVLSGRVADASDLDEYIERFAESIRQLCDYAQKMATFYQLEIVLEFFNNRGDPWLAIGDLDVIHKLLNKIDCFRSSFGLTFDTSHVIQLGGSLDEYYFSLKKYIRHIHFSNCIVNDYSSTLFGDKHPPFEIPGGALRHNDIINFVKMVDWSLIDICSFEFIPSELYDQAFSLQSLAKSYEIIFNEKIVHFN